MASAQYCTPDQCDECDLKNCRLSCCYDPPDLWLVNTRCLPKCNNLDEGFERISIKHYDRKCCRWTDETLESFLAQEASMPSLIFAHGNTLKHHGAMKQCWLIYEQDALLPRTRSDWCSGRGPLRSPSSDRCFARGCSS